MQSRHSRTRGDVKNQSQKRRKGGDRLIEGRVKNEGMRVGRGRSNGGLKAQRRKQLLLTNVATGDLRIQRNKEEHSNLFEYVRLLDL